MSDDDPIIVCCILGICCPAASPSQQVALARLIRRARPHLTLDEVEQRASRVLEAHNYFAAIREIVDAA